MKPRIDYKRKKTLIIALISVVLIAVSAIGITAFLKEDKNTSAVSVNKNVSSRSSESNDVSSSNGENGDIDVNYGSVQNNETFEENTNIDSDTNNSNMENNEDNNTSSVSTEVNSNREEVASQNANVQASNQNAQTSNENTQTQTTTTTTTNNRVPNQEYIQETVIQGEDKKVEESTEVAWKPITVSGITGVAKFGINKPSLETEKLVFVNAKETLDLENAKQIEQNAKKDDILTYVIKVHNTSKKMIASNIRVSDCIPEGTEYIENSASNDGKIDENKNIIWKININTEETVVLSFKVKVMSEDFSIIENTAKVDGENTNTVYTPIVISKTVTKIWDDNNSEKRPESITIAIYDGKEKIDSKEVTENAEGNWEVTFDNLKKYRDDGKTEIDYTFDEVNVPEGYVKIIEENVITNHLPRIDVTKKVASVNNIDVPENAIITVTKGDLVGYEITVTNTGNITLNNVTVTDILDNNKKVFFNPENKQDKTNTLEAYKNGLTLAPNESKTYYVYYEIEDNDQSNVTLKPSLENTVKAIGYYEVENNKGQKQEKNVQDEDDAIINFKHIYDISLEKNQSVDSIQLNKKEEETKLKPGQTIDYTVTIKNTGNTKLTEVKVTDFMNADILGKNRTVKINSVKVNNKVRAYEETENGVLLISGDLQVNDILTINASYVVTENDMSIDKANLIKNTATVITKETPEKSDSVEISTIIWKTEIKVNKVGNIEVKDNSGNTSFKNAHEQEVKYGDEIIYTLTATNDGTKPGEFVIQDVDLNHMFVNNYITAPEKVNVETYNKNEENTKYAITNDTVKSLNDGIKVYIPAGKTAKVEFKIKVIAPAGTILQNKVVGNDQDIVINPVAKQVNVSASSNPGKNIIIVLDLSSSMVRVPRANVASRDECIFPGDYDKGFEYLYVKDAANSVERPESNLAKAKIALKAFADEVLNKSDGDNQITLISFNYSSYEVTKQAMKNTGEWYYANSQRPRLADLEAHKEIHDYVGVHELVTTDNYNTFAQKVDNIKIRSEYLLTDMVAGLQAAEAKVNELKDNGRETEVIFFGDGKPSIKGETATGGYFYDEATTASLLQKSANNIKSKAGLYTVEYLLNDAAKSSFKDMTGINTQDDKIRFSANRDDVTTKLKNIADVIDAPTTEKQYKTDENGISKIDIELGALRVEPNANVVLYIDNKKYAQYSSIDEINSSDSLKYEKNGDKECLKLDTTKFEPGSSIKITYYYK